MKARSPTRTANGMCTEPWGFQAQLHETTRSQKQRGERSIWFDSSQIDFGGQESNQMPKVKVKIKIKSNAVGESGIKSFDFGIKIKSQNQNQIQKSKVKSNVAFDLELWVQLASLASNLTLSPGLKVKWLGLKVKWPRPKVKSKVKSQVKVKSQKSKSKSNQIRLAEPESNVKWNQLKSQIRAPKVKSNWSLPPLIIRLRYWSIE